jgi:UDP-N-acetylglucosamine 2-epimerase (non-hydrolysing)
MTMLHAAGSLSDLVRLTPVVQALGRAGGLRQVVVHVGDAPPRPDSAVHEPDRWLGVRASTHGERTALMLHRFEHVIVHDPPDLVVVCGASDGALACALAAAKQGLPVAHLEAGLRATDMLAPANVNRVLTDRLADTLLTPTWDASANLIDEGIPDSRISTVGNTAVDVLRRHQDAAARLAAWRRLGVDDGEYVLVLLRGPADGTSDEAPELGDALAELATRHSVVVSMPAGLRPRSTDEPHRPARRAGLLHVEPASYLEHLSLELGAGAIVTDIGAVQDDASALGVPCFTLADGTDRPATLAHGTNQLLGTDPESLDAVRLRRGPRAPRPIPLWDGFAGRRAAQRLVAHHVLVRGAAAPWAA